MEYLCGFFLWSILVNPAIARHRTSRRTVCIIRTCTYTYYVFVNTRERESSTEQQSRSGIACGSSEVSRTDCLVPPVIRIPLFLPASSFLYLSRSFPTSRLPCLVCSLDLSPSTRFSLLAAYFSFVRLFPPLLAAGRSG